MHLWGVATNLFSYAPYLRYSSVLFSGEMEQINQSQIWAAKVAVQPHRAAPNAKKTARHTNNLTVSVDQP